MTPEEVARREIDRQLAQCGWLVQDRNEMNISAGSGIAVREYPMLTGEADYLLYVAGKAIGVVEAKPKGHPLTGVESQAARYAGGLPPEVPSYGKPLPFSYQSTGIVTQFTNLLEPDPRSREVFTFHRPEELLRLTTLDDQVRSLLRKLPPLSDSRLWKVQERAITNLEKSLSENRARSLLQMATGSGKTFTAVNACYRLIKYGGAKRILFLVDRTNLGTQTYNEFQQFVSPLNGYKFTEEYGVQHLTGQTISKTSKVVITTIQRLYSILKGEPEFDASAEERSMFEDDSPLVSKPLPVVYNESIPIETFDFVIIDECHRSIYNLWRQVLDYFDAFLIGLSATPGKQTIGFFQNNLVMEFGHSEAVAEGINVDFDVYPIRTRITENGATLEREPGRLVPHMDRRTRAKRYAELDADLTYTAKEVDKVVLSTDQIRLIIRTFRDRLFTEIFPGRTEVPKTLVFAKDDNHAEEITKIIRDEFAKGNDFCQKITYRTGFIWVEEETTGPDGTTVKRGDWKKVSSLTPEQVLKSFRKSYNPRIAVTVDMVATGTDVKPIECVMFLRSIKSAAYFEQMKGRGCRVASVDEMQSVTSDAVAKTHFVVVDAVGVTDDPKCATKPLDRKPSVPLDKVLDLVAKGVAHPDVVSTLAARLARLDRNLTEDDRRQVAEKAGGVDIHTLSNNLLASLDPDAQAARIQAEPGSEAGQEPTEEQLDAVQEQMMAEALRPFHNPQLRNLLLSLNRMQDLIIDEINQDELLEAGFSAQARDKAQALITSFRAFIEQHKDELEALQILYSRPHRAGLRYRQVKDLAAALRQPPLGTTPERVWQAYRSVEPQAVKGTGGNHLTDLVALVRHALDPQEPIVPYASTVDARYRDWIAEQESRGLAFTAEQRQWLDAIRDHIAQSMQIEADDFDMVPFNQFGGLGRAHDLFGERLMEILEELNRRLAA